MSLSYLMRHAKSDWNTPLADLERPLSPRGREDAPRIGAELARRGARPGVILSSPAQRARATAGAVAAAFAEPPHIEFIERLYLATPHVLRETLWAWKDSEPMVVAHNPGLDALLEALCDDLPYTRSGKLMTTANVAIIDWDGRRGRLIDLIRPRALS